MSNKFVVWQNVDQIKSKNKIKESCYWDYFNEKCGGEESNTANPDTVADEDLFWLPRLTNKQKEILKEMEGFDFATILNPQEAKLLSLIVQEGRNIKGVRKTLLFSRQRINQLLKNISYKIKKHFKLEE